MSFLQPALLFALPVVLLPIVIHLINQRRFQTVHWAAMQFLLAANRVSQGYARIRRWLILAARMAAIAALVFAISRPLTSGWLGLAGGGRIDTAIILLDRSPSMTMRAAGGRSKLESGLNTLVRSLQTLAPGRCVLIDSGNVSATELDSPEQLLRLPQTSAIAKSADLPAMIEAVKDYIAANQPSRCDVWICSDLRRHDWNSDSGRWDVVRQGLAALPQAIRFHLLTLPTIETGNRSLRVTAARRADGRDGSQLLLSLQVGQGEQVDQPSSIPIQLELNGARSELNVQISGSRLQLHNHQIPLDSSQTRGWGRLSIGPDTEPADNQFFFVYDQARPRKTVIVAEAETSLQPIEFAASLSSDPDIVYSYQKLTPQQWVGSALADVALVIWHSAIPESGSPSHRLLESFSDRGGRVIFFPPSIPTEASFAGVRWTKWRRHDGASVGNWVGDQDLLGRTLAGESLPVDDLQFLNSCGLQGDYVSLAQIDQQVPILVRATAEKRNVYFCASSVALSDSSLAENGVVLYAMIQRALLAGVESLAGTGMRVAGQIEPLDTRDWQQLAGDPNALSTEYADRAGVYSSADQLIAINRSIGEDIQVVLAEAEIADLFVGLDFDRVEIESADDHSLIQEIWRACLLLMLAALIAEAALCIPGLGRSGSRQSASASFA